MTQEQLNTLKEITIAGYLHDIGKFAQRAGSNNSPSYPYYSSYTDNFLSSFKNVFPQELDSGKIIRFATKHHNAETFEECCIAEANRLSSGMDRSFDNSESDTCSEFAENSLISILSTLKISERDKPKKIYYKLSPLEPSNIFGEENIKNSKSSYSELWKEFEKDYSCLSGLSFNNFIKSLDSLLLRYTWCIPASESADDDISLYQHLKTTASFASVLYRYHISKNDKNILSVQDKNSEKFLFINGDISGIQKHIFDIKNNESSAKLLRAKSFELMALSQIISEHLVHNFDGSIADIFSSSGGRFQLVIPYYDNAESKLKEIRRLYDSFFLNEFAGKLSFIVSTGTKAKGLDLSSNNVNNLINRLGYDGDCSKQKKMQSVLLEDNGYVLDRLYNKLSENGECSCCGVLPAEKKDENCKNCDFLINIGGNLVRAAGVKLKSDKISSLDYMINVVRKLPEEDKSYLSINEYYKGRGILYLPYIAPRKNDVFLSFGEIANNKEAVGANKLAMFKADIDNLGLIFSSSLGDDRVSFSRYADVSRMFHYFFSYYYTDFIEKKYKNKIYTVFSGGDDICVIGHWYDILHFAADFHKELNRFTNSNPSITLSAGIALSSASVPVKFMAEEAEAMLDKSKSCEFKNSITVFDTSVSWDVYEKCLEDGEKFRKALEYYKNNTNESESLSTAIVYKLLDFSNRVKKIHEGDLRNIRNLMWKSDFHYMVARNLKDKGKSNTLINWFCHFAADYKKMQASKISVSYGLYTQRENKN